MFELQFSMYYTLYECVQISVKIYLTPKTENDTKSFNSPRNSGLKGIDTKEPIFIGKLTSDYLFRLTKQALFKSYKAKNWMERYH